MIGVGMFLTHIGWLNDGNASLISRLVVKVALPGTIISNLFTYYSQETILTSLVGMIVPLISIIISMALARLAAGLLKIPERRVGVFCAMFSFSNSIFIGMPVSLALFTEVAVPYTLMYYIANTFLFWSVGIAFMRKDGGHVAEHGDITAVPRYLIALLKYGLGYAENPKHNMALRPAHVSLMAIKRALPLPLVVFFGCVLMIVWGLVPPKFVMDAAKYIGNMVTPLSLFFTGIIITRMLKKGRIRWERGYGPMLIGRFLIAPLSIYLFSLFIPMDMHPTDTLIPLMRNVLIMQACMPVMSQTSIVAETVGADAEYAAGGTALSTLISLITIPVFMAIVGMI